MLRLPHSNQQENTSLFKKYKKAFTIIEIIIALSIGSVLIMITYNVLGQSLKTINETTVAGTMDNYAYNIQKQIRKELINAKYLDIASIKNNAVITKDNEEIHNIYYANESSLIYGIMYDENLKRIFVVFNPQDSENKEISVIFNEAGSNGVKLKDFKWNIDDYSVNTDDFNAPDFNAKPSRLIKYQFTLTKNYPNGKQLEKTYHFKEVLENAI